MYIWILDHAPFIGNSSKPWLLSMLWLIFSSSSCAAAAASALKYPVWDLNSVSFCGTETEGLPTSLPLLMSFEFICEAAEEQPVGRSSPWWSFLCWCGGSCNVCRSSQRRWISQQPGGREGRFWLAENKSRKPAQLFSAEDSTRPMRKLDFRL